MYTGTLIEDLVRNVERAEARSREVQQLPVRTRVEMPVVYAYGFRYADQLVEVA
jgi:hypothetical protein